MLTQQAIVHRILAGLPRDAQAEAEAFAPSNIALCKYWGKRDEELNLPLTSSLSVSLGALGSRVRIRPGGEDRFTLNGEPLAAESEFHRRVFAFIDLFRPSPAARYDVNAENTVPTAAGFASSASGFASLVLALDRLYRWNLDRRALSILARLGSGSASRSLYDGFVEWHAGTSPDGMDSFAEPIDARWPDLRMGLVVISGRQKKIASRPGMKRTVASSPLYAAWPAKVERDLAELRAAIRETDFERLGRTAESNALAMHATMIAAWPPVLYWLPESVAAMHRVGDLRADGVPVYFTMDAGPNLKLLFPREQETRLVSEFPGLQVVAPFGPG